MITFKFKYNGEVVEVSVSPYVIVWAIVAIVHLFGGGGHTIV